MATYKIALPEKATVSGRVTKSNKPAKAALEKFVRNSAEQNARKSAEAMFGRDAPSRRLRMPESYSITAVEQLTFFPNTLRSHDFLDRLLGHGIDTQTVANIINHHRKVPKYPVQNDSICKTIQKCMQQHHPSVWVREKIVHWTMNNRKAGIFSGVRRDNNDLTFTGMQLDFEDFPRHPSNKKGVVLNIPFANLAKNVRTFPSIQGGDALTLMPCIVHAAEHPEEGWLFPRDIVTLTQLTGGPRMTEAKHKDSAVFSRWINSYKIGSI
ncbi:hypothetical protein P153DRAFT_387307 [Dothidotthia symphoricarpi CBS 119687]|uniref:Uncharacterized protein n=1 Tax=Dothidotthia symphoricarpi CBS 119687 TaxID=1392245 RepID=A0A6A6A8N2_9PLEO|nr:uncharacterized protein P153DRAFT_387307 [Dothidotthia symphoricarpi CBS 119687]KAF2127565.1 hypothetical protein P153DRAFT_387307 [Dothidotthia symphoricarpi CBS 119687]